MKIEIDERFEVEKVSRHSVVLYFFLGLMMLNVSRSQTRGRD